MRERPKDYQGPSWSWLAVSGVVRPGWRYSHPRPPDKRRILEEEPVIHVLSRDVGLKEPSAPYGAVTHAILTVEAHISPVTLEFEEEQGFCICRDIASEDGDNMVRNRLDVHFDTTCESLED